MKRISDFFISIFISVEFLVALVFFAPYQIFPNYFTYIGTRLTQNSASIKYLTFIPAGLLAMVMKENKKLLFPDLPSNDIFQEWPDFYMIEYRYYLSLLIIGFCFILCVGIWALNIELSSGHFFAVFSASITISIITYVHFHLATIKLRRILSKMKKRTQ